MPILWQKTTKGTTMNIEQRSIIIKDLFDECLETSSIKGKAYADNDDSLSNFKQVAKLTSLTSFQVWQIYFLKHVISILQAIKENPELPVEKSESLRGRIKDTIIYAAILEAMSQDATQLQELKTHAEKAFQPKRTYVSKRQSKSDTNPEQNI